jgi:hypothetical protein
LINALSEKRVCGWHLRATGELDVRPQEGRTVNEAEWLASKDVWEMFGGVSVEASPRKLRLFAVACCRCSESLLSNADHRRAVDLAERFADGLATEQELGTAFRRAKEFTLGLRGGKTEREIRRWAEAGAVLNATAPPDRGRSAAAETGWHVARSAASQEVDASLAALLRDIVGNPFRPMTRLRPPDPPWLTAKVLAATGPWTHLLDSWFNPAWVTSDAVALARQMYESRDFSAMPILADALQDTGCDHAGILDHCRDEKATHVRGCWVVDLVLGKE